PICGDHGATEQPLSTRNANEMERGHTSVDDDAMIRETRGGRSARANGRPGRRLADEVHDTLLRQLMSSRFMPDSRLTIDALARELGVSQTPIRDALNRMEADGLVVRVPRSEEHTSELQSREN